MRRIVAVSLVVLALSAAGASAGTYARLSSGAMWFYNDLEVLDTGAQGMLALGYAPLNIVEFELEGGYFQSERSRDPKLELWGVPLMANARVALPITPIVKPYIGAGIGGMYLNSRIDGGVFDDLKQDDWVFAGNACLGVKLKLGPVSAGIEGKCYISEKAKIFGGRNRVEALSGMLFVALGF